MLCGALLLAGCREASSPPRLIAVRADGAVLEIEFDRPVTWRELVIRDAEGNEVQTLPGAGRRASATWPFLGEAGAAYRLEIVCDEGTTERPLTWPAAPVAVRAELHLPLGQERIPLAAGREATALVPAASRLRAALVVESHAAAPQRCQWSITLEAPPAAPQRLAEGESALDVPGDLFWREFDVETPPAGADARLVCRLQFADAEPIEHVVTLQTAPFEELARWLTVEEIVFPADRQGTRRLEQRADAVTLPNLLWQAARRALTRSAAENPYEPQGQHALRLHNAGPAPLHLRIETDVATHAAGPGQLAFAPPTWLAPRESAVSQTLLRVPPGGSATAVIPLFVRPDATAGSYLRRFRLFAVGSERPLLETSVALGVERSRLWASGTALAALLAAPLAWLVVAWRGKAWAADLGTANLACIAVLAAVHFLISSAARLAGGIASAVLGPFQVFFVGLGNELFTTALLAAAIVLAPRPGTFFFSSLTVALLNGLFTGQLGLSDSLFVSVSFALNELLLWLGGPTRSAGPLPERRATALRLALILGMGNGLALWTQFCLAQSLHRLYFAEWYVAAVAGVTGLGYGFVGAWLGTGLGFRLRRAAP